MRGATNCRKSGSSRRLASSAIAWFWIVAACGGGGSDAPTATAPVPSVAQLEVTPVDPQLIAGGSLALVAIPLNAQGNRVTDVSVTWTSTAPTVASVNSASGFVTGLAAGTATITATAGGRQASTQVTVVPWTVSATSYAAGTLAFVSNRAGEQALFVIDPAGLHQLTGGRDLPPQWHPSGERLLFVRHGTGQVYVVNADGSGLAPLINASLAAWSPEGARLAFVRFSGPDRGIWVGDATGAGAIRIVDLAAAPFSGFFSGLEWSPDGTRLAFAAGPSDGLSDVFVIAGDGTGLLNVTNSEQLAEEHFAWSRDSQRLAVANQNFVAGQNWSVFVVNADGTGFTRVTGPTGDTHPSWTPDGRIAFQSEREGSSAIYTINPDGSALKRFTPYGLAASALPLSWSADGTRVAFAGGVDQTDIFVMSANGMSLTRLAPHPASDLWPLWKP